MISKDEYNRKVGLLLACPITSRKKGYPFEVELPAGLPIVEWRWLIRFGPSIGKPAKRISLAGWTATPWPRALAQFDALIRED